MAIDNQQFEGWKQKTQEAQIIMEYERAKNMLRPSYMLRPSLSIDGNKWCALYGDNLQDGVAGFGDSPEEAYLSFDSAWVQNLNSED